MSTYILEKRVSIIWEIGKRVSVIWEKSKFGQFWRCIFRKTRNTKMVRNPKTQRTLCPNIYKNMNSCFNKLPITNVTTS